jgi:DNA-binding transcriptional ArsR family regulator
MWQGRGSKEGRVPRAQQPLIDDASAIRLADTFKALSDPTRVRIISALLHDELCVHELADAVGASQSAVSHQLRTLREMRLVRFRKEGRHVFYTLDDDHIYQLFRQGLEHISHE